MNLEEWLAGSCHCGRVRFRVCVREFMAGDCNCSMCTKKGFIHYIAPEADFELVAGSELLATYTFGTHTAKHHFCSACGSHPFYRPRSHPSDWDINVRCLENDAVSRFRIDAFDGKNWEQNVDAFRERTKVR